MSPSKSSETPRFLTPQEAAELLRVSKSFLDKLRMHGDGPEFIKIGSRVRYLVTDLDAWTVARRFTSTNAISRNRRA